MATASLRPLSIGEILDAALKVVIRHWKPLMLAVIVPILPLTILSVLLTASLETDLSQFETSGDPADIEAVVLGLGRARVARQLPHDVHRPGGLLQGRRGRVAGRRAVRRPVVAVRVAAHGSRCSRWSSLMLVTFLLGLIACGIPSIWLSVMWSVATAALLFERLGPIKALGRSFELIKQRFWATFLLLIITTLLTFFVTAVVQGIPSGLATVFAPDNEIATAVTDIIFGTIGSAMVLPISAAVFAILYFDQRVRKEGFDVQLLAEGIGAAYDPNAPIPAPLRPDPNAAPPQGWQPQQPPPGYWQPPPPPGWQPPPQQYGGGWSAPAHDAPPLRWGPAAGPPQDERPPEESPWMAPGPPASGGWAPPAGAAPTDHRWGPRETRPPAATRDRRRGAPGDETPAGDERWTPRHRRRPPSAPAGDDSPLRVAAPAGGLAVRARRATTRRPRRRRRRRADRARRRRLAARVATPPPAVTTRRPRPTTLRRPPRWGPSSPFGESPWEDKPDEDDKRKKRDDDWQPPEEPRGPGGL